MTLNQFMLYNAAGWTLYALAWYSVPNPHDKTTLAAWAAFVLFFLTSYVALWWRLFAQLTAPVLVPESTPTLEDGNETPRTIIVRATNHAAITPGPAIDAISTLDAPALEDAATDEIIAYLREVLA